MNLILYNQGKFTSSGLEIVNPELLQREDVNRVKFFLDICLWSQLDKYEGKTFPLPPDLKFKEICKKCGSNEGSGTGLLCCSTAKMRVLRLVKVESEESQPFNTSDLRGVMDQIQTYIDEPYGNQAHIDVRVLKDWWNNISNSITELESIQRKKP